jgi:hypothetical protein
MVMIAASSKGEGQNAEAICAAVLDQGHGAVVEKSRNT